MYQECSHSTTYCCRPSLVCEALRCVVSTSTVHLSTLPRKKQCRYFQEGLYSSMCHKKTCRLTTTTENPSIFPGHTVVNSKPIMSAMSEVCFTSITIDIVQDNKTCSRPKVRGLCSSCSYRNKTSC